MHYTATKHKQNKTPTDFSDSEVTVVVFNLCLYPHSVALYLLSFSVSLSLVDNSNSPYFNKSLVLIMLTHLCDINPSLLLLLFFAPFSFPVML